MNSTQNKVNGATDVALGSIKKVVGTITGDEKMKSDADAQKTAGEVQKAVGHAKEAVKQGLHSAGDAAVATAKKIEATSHAALEKVIGAASDQVEKLTH